MFGLMPYERRSGNLTNYFDALERSFFSDLPMTKTPVGFRTDIVDAGDSFRLEAELPGFSKEDIHVEHNGTTLTIRAEHNDNSEKKSEGYLCRERHFGSFVRSFDTTGIDIEKIEAAYENGVLTLTLPKQLPQEPPVRKIEIR